MIHIFGSTGYLGSKFCNTLTRSGIKFLQYSSKKDSNSIFFDLNVMNMDYLKFIKTGDIIFFFSAISSPETCEINIELANRINFDSTCFYIKNILSKNAKLFFMSTDLVYGNNKRINDEFSSTEPVGVYASLKNKIENIFKSDSLFTSLRLSYVFSHADKFYLYVMDSIKHGFVAEIYNGIYRNIIGIDYVIDFFIKLCEINYMDNKLIPGIINVCGYELLSRLDMAYILKQSFHKFIYKTINPSESFLNIRPNLIITKSLFLDKLLLRNTNSYYNFIIKGDL